MTDQEINIAIAESQGWKKIYFLSFEAWMDESGKAFGLVGISPTCDVQESNVPNYCNDLNAMHEAEETLTGINGMPEQYGCILSQTVLRGAMPLEITARFKIAHATARQRAEAFLKTLGMWVDK